MGIPMSGPGHNSATFAAEQLQGIIDRVERVNGEIAGLRADVREIFTEAASAGYDVPTLRRIIRERADLERKGKDAIAEREALLDTYRAALGGLADTDLGRAAMERV